MKDLGDCTRSLGGPRGFNVGQKEVTEAVLGSFTTEVLKGAGYVKGLGVCTRSLGGPGGCNVGQKEVMEASLGGFTRGPESCL